MAVALPRGLQARTPASCVPVTASSPPVSPSTGSVWDPSSPSAAPVPPRTGRAVIPGPFPGLRDHVPPAGWFQTTEADGPSVLETGSLKSCHQQAMTPRQPPGEGPSSSAASGVASNPWGSLAANSIAPISPIIATWHSLRVPLTLPGQLLGRTLGICIGASTPVSPHFN